MSKSRAYRYQLRGKRALFYWSFVIASYIFPVFGLPLEFAILSGDPYLDCLRDMLVYVPLFPALSLIFPLLFLLLPYTDQTVVTEQGVYRTFPVNGPCWEAIESVEWLEKKRFLIMHHPNRPIYKFRKKSLLCFPINNPDLFKADVIKYAPEGNPLRVWVESEQFAKIIQEDKTYKAK